jgi:hypothetical protein
VTGSGEIPQVTAAFMVHFLRRNAEEVDCIFSVLLPFGPVSSIPALGKRAVTVCLPDDLAVRTLGESP